jgi:putative CocE/NonD family hydrolase
VAACFLLALPRASLAQGLEFVKANFTKNDMRIRMRDGVRLFTSVYVPKDSSKRYPILLMRTPYSVGPYGVDRYPRNLGPSALVARAGYIIAYQDVRGCFLSEGRFEDMRPQRDPKAGPREIDESTDTYDTIAWLVDHVAGNNGKVGLWGISYPGFYAAAGLIGAHPSLRAVSPQAPLVDWFIGDDLHHNGAFFLHQEFNFEAVFGAPRPEPTNKPHPRFDHGIPDAYEFFLRMGPLSQADARHFKGKRAFWNDVMNHGTYDAFWKSRALLPHLTDVQPAVLTVGGWFDAEDLYGPLQTYKTIEATSPRATNTLVMGPWTHGGWSRGEGESLGPLEFNAKTSEFFREKIELPFFEFHLKGAGAWNPPDAWIFETGTNEWRRYDAWPPRTARQRPLFLRSEGRLSFEAPDESADDVFDEFPSDPARPVPYTARVAIDCPPEFMAEDQRFAASRPDVLVYQTAPLTEDLTVVGPIQAELIVSITGTDADWVVKLIDVYPDDTPDREGSLTPTRMGGYQQLVRGDVIRGKFRNSLERPEPFVAGDRTRVAFAMHDVSHSFRSGHRVMVQIQSSWFPLVDRNPQTFVDIYHAKASDFAKGTHRVFRNREHASRLEVLVQP